MLSYREQAEQLLLLDKQMWVCLPTLHVACMAPGRQLKTEQHVIDNHHLLNSILLCLQLVLNLSCHSYSQGRGGPTPAGL